MLSCHVRRVAACSVTSLARVDFTVVRGNLDAMRTFHTYLRPRRRRGFPVESTGLFLPPAPQGVPAAGSGPGVWVLTRRAAVLGALCGAVFAVIVVAAGGGSTVTAQAQPAQATVHTADAGQPEPGHTGEVKARYARVADPATLPRTAARQAHAYLHQVLR